MLLSTTIHPTLLTSFLQVILLSHLISAVSYVPLVCMQIEQALVRAGAVLLVAMVSRLVKQILTVLVRIDTNYTHSCV